MPHSPFQTVVKRITAVCDATAPCSLLLDLRARLERQSVPAAVKAHDTAALYDWLMPTLSYQGVSDAVAWAYMDRYGSVTHAEVVAALDATPACPRLGCYWSYAECGFAKSAYTCGSPEHLDDVCPVPRHDLRNGRLNQTAYSLALFLRDVCGDDLVGWLDTRLLAADMPGSVNRPAVLRTAVLDPLSGIYGVSAKGLVDGAGRLTPCRRPRARAMAGCRGQHDRRRHAGPQLDAPQWVPRRPRGPNTLTGRAATLPAGCASIIETASEHIDARRLLLRGAGHLPPPRAKGDLAPLHRERARSLQRQPHRRPPGLLPSCVPGC